MKKLFFACAMLLASIAGLHAQDIITKHNGDDIKAKILEVTQDEIKYKRYDNQNGPTFTLSKSEVLMVRYEDGTKDLFNESQPATQPRQQARQQQPQPRQQQSTHTQQPKQTNANYAQPDGTFAGEMRNMFKKDPNAQISIGVRAGFNLSKMRGTEFDEWIEDFEEADGNGGIKARPGFQIGAVADIPITYGFYVQPGLFFTTRGTRFKYKEEYHGDKYSWVSAYRPFYMQIPVLASFRANVTNNLQVQVNTGPYLAVGLGGKVVYKYDNTEDGERYKGSDVDGNFFGKDKNGYGYQRFDFGWCFGAGLTISKNIYVGIQYDLGCINIEEQEYKKYGYTAYNGNFAIQVGYNFQL